MKKYLFIFTLLLVACASFAADNKLCLNDIVVGYDMDGPVYPMQAISGYGELYLEPLKLNFNEICNSKTITVNMRDRKLECSPAGDKSKKFVFATFQSTQKESDSEWTVVFLTYDRNKVELIATPNVATEQFDYFLDIQNNQ